MLRARFLHLITCHVPGPGIETVTTGMLSGRANYYNTAPLGDTYGNLLCRVPVLCLVWEIARGDEQSYEQLAMFGVTLVISNYKKHTQGNIGRLLSRSNKLHSIEYCKQDEEISRRVQSRWRHWNSVIGSVWWQISYFTKLTRISAKTLIFYI